MRWVALALAVVTFSCGGEDELPPLEVPAGCNPLASEHDCMLPYPSDFFIEDGFVRPSEAALTLFESDFVLDPFPVHRPTAFSVGNQIMALFPQGVDAEPLVGPHNDFSESLGDDSPTVLVDVETSERVLHLAELDPRAPDPSRQALLIRPLQRLRNNARYVVGIRGLSDKEGVTLPTPEGFRRLRDGVSGADSALAAAASRYDADVFAPLESAGVARSELQLAWDFTTQPMEETTRDLLSIRKQVIDYFADNTAAISVVSIEDNPDEDTFRRLELTVTVPLFMENRDPYAPLFRDSAGEVAQNGTVEVPFAVLVPQSVANRPMGAAPARLLQFGHGFFGDRGEIDGFVDSLANEREMVVVAADWWGMSGEDRDVVANKIVEDTSNLMRFTDRVHQGMANFMAVAFAATGPLVDLPELQVGDGPIFDPSELYFYGISQGGILGGTYLGISPHINKGVLSVGGANFSFMMFRARPFLAFLAVLQAVTTDPLDHQKFTMLTQTSFDRVEPITYAPWILDSPLQDGPTNRQLLMQVAIGDDQVPNFASHIHARSIGVPLLQPENRNIVGLGVEQGPTPSALVEFDFGVPAPLPGTEGIPPTTENEGHEGVRRLLAAKEQLHRFFQPGGVVEHTCSGSCDPE